MEVKTKMNKRLKNYKVLVVDDDEDIREIIVSKLELHEAICDEAPDGILAFDKIKENNYDCVVTDIRMPNASGIELANMIRDYTGKSPKLILMSAFTDINNDIAKSLGALGLFMKPDDLDNLIQLIEDSSF